MIVIYIGLGKLFTGTYDGRILEIDVDGEVQRTVAQFGKPPCGRLTLKFIVSVG